jgi:hypothetical protein
VLAAGHRGPVVAVAAAAWAACGGLALAVVFPRLPHGDRRGFPAYAAATPEQALAWIEGRPAEVTAAYLVAMSRLAMTKYRLVQASVGAGAVALGLTAGALL